MGPDGCGHGPWELHVWTDGKSPDRTSEGNHLSYVEPLLHKHEGPPQMRRPFGVCWYVGYLMMLNRWTVFCPLTVMFTMYTPLAMSLGRSRMVVKRSPLFPNSLAKTCLP